MFAIDTGNVNLLLIQIWGSRWDLRGAHLLWKGCAFFTNSHLLPFLPHSSVISGTAFLSLEDEMKYRRCIWKFSPNIQPQTKTWSICICYALCQVKARLFLSGQTLSETDRRQKLHLECAVNPCLWIWTFHGWTWVILSINPGVICTWMMCVSHCLMQITGLWMQ